MNCALAISAKWAAFRQPFINVPLFDHLPNIDTSVALRFRMVESPVRVTTTWGGPSHHFLERRL